METKCGLHGEKEIANQCIQIFAKLTWLELWKMEFMPNLKLQNIPSNMIFEFYFNINM